MQIVVPEELYLRLRKQSFDEKISMSQIIVGTLGGTKHILPRELKILNMPQTTYVTKTSNVCKHGSMIGLCKFNCK